MPQSGKSTFKIARETINVKHESPEPKRKIKSEPDASPDPEFAARQAIEKLDRLDDDYMPEDGNEPASKKQKTSSKADGLADLCYLDTYPPPEKPKTQSRKDWASTYCKRILKEMPSPRQASTTAILAAYGQSKALNVFMLGEFEYQSSVASGLRRKGKKHLQMARERNDELEVAVARVDTAQTASKMHKKVPAPVPAKTAVLTHTEKSRFESIITNMANEIGNLKMQLETEKHDKLAAEQSSLDTQRQLQTTEAQIRHLQRHNEQPLAALRVEVAQYKDERNRAEQQLKETLSDRSKAESEILVLKKELDDSMKTVRQEYLNRHQKVEKNLQELKERLSKQEKELNDKNKLVRDQRVAFTTAIAAFRSP